MNTLQIPGIGTFEVDIWEQGSGAPLVYLHGYERHPGAAPFLTALAAEHRVIAPELPGFGSSTGFELFRDVHDVAYFYRALLGSLGIGPVDLVGHSLGGMFAAELAALAPQLVRSLVLVDPFGVWVDDERPVDPFGGAADVAGALWHGEPPATVPSNFESESGEEQALFAARNLGTAGKFMWPIADRGVRRRLPYIEAPTLIVRGASDGLVPDSHARVFAGLIPNASTATIDAAGHYPMIEQQQAFLETVEGFLARHGGATTKEDAS